MHILIQVLKTKIKNMDNKKIALSAVLMKSQIDITAAVRQRCRIYNSSIGRYSYIGRNSLVQKTSIGSFCSISEECNIGMPAHPTNLVSSSPVFLNGSNVLHKNFASFKFENCPETKIGNDVWVGARAQIKSGLTIGDGAIIAAGAVVTHDVPPYSIVGGIPSRVIRYRFDDNVINQLILLQWWNWNDKKIQKYSYLFNEPTEFIHLIIGQ